ncbi:MAG: hypothetical protein J6I49_05835 [Bacteroidales bacterium]|nr:hypothetical protein [Bacteroidales bacterium]
MFGLLYGGLLSAQQTGSSLEPDWVSGTFIERANSYIEVVRATASSQDDARTKALQQLVERRSLATGTHYDVQVSGGQVQVSGRDALTVKARVIDEYSRRDSRGQWTVSLLVQTCKNPMLDYEPVHVSDRQPFSYKWFIPGTTQLAKRQKGKSAAMIATEVAMVAGIVAAEGMRQTYTARAASTHNANLRVQNTNNANTCATIRNVCIASAAAVYLWSFIDAAVGKGPRHLTVASAEMNLVPWVSGDGAGLALNFKL